MSKYLIEDTTLTSIADAVREKSGTTELIKVSELPTAIAAIESGSGGGNEPTTEDLTFTGNLTYWNFYGHWNNIIAKYNSLITFNNITAANAMFQYSNAKNYGDLKIEHLSSSIDVSSMFRENVNLTTLPQTKLKPRTIQYLFRDCHSLKEIPEDYFTNWDLGSLTMGSAVFMNCYSLRKFPTNFINDITSSYYSNYSSFPYFQMAYNCYSLEEIADLPDYNAIPNLTLPSNMFASAFLNTNRLKKLTFKTQEDGSSMVVRWKSQTIDLSSTVGYGPVANITGYNSGITTATQVTDDATYQALKDNADWFTANVAYSRYNHDSAVETINSLPDTSAYLAEKGGTNTIKFTGAAGSATDGGAINTLTEEEIAVATAKGWTVTLV